MTDFSALLSKPADSFERPKPLPEGDYLALIGKREFLQAKNEKKTPFVRFTMQLQEALPSVDADSLATALGEKSLSEKTMTLDLYLTGDSMWRLGQFLVDHAGAEPGIPAAEQIEQISGTGRQVLVTVKHRINNQKPEEPPYVFIDATAAVPA